MRENLWKLALVLVAVPMVGCGMGDSEDLWGNGSPPSGGFDAGVLPPSELPGSEGQADGRDDEPGDRFEAVGTNPFVRADHDPFSTFGADVDTASYDVFARDVALGLLPAPASVRLEEYVNIFDYEYPAPEPDSEAPFAINLAASPHPLGRAHAQVRVGIQAQEAPEERKLPTSLTFLVDVSGSMSAEDKLPLAQQLIVASLDALEADDTVSIVSYASDTRVRLTPTPVRERAAIERAVEELSAAGSTAGSQGIQLAYQQAEAGFLAGGFNHVVLLTDGDFNIGISDSSELVELIRTKRNTGITLTALGFGRGNLNDQMMEAVSNAGNGIYSVITSVEHASRYARESLLSTVTLVAQDMKIQVEFNPDHVLAYRLLGYENRAIADNDFRNDVVDAGEVGAGHRVTALYEVVLVGGEIPLAEGAPELDTGEPVEGEREIDALDLVEVRVRWKRVGASETDEASEISASLEPVELAGAEPEAEPDFLWASAVAGFAEILKESPFADEAELEVIRDIVATQSERGGEHTRFAELLEQAVAMMGHEAR